MRFLISFESTIKLCSAVLEECFVRSMGYVNEDNSIDWLGYYHHCKEQMLVTNAARQNNLVAVVYFINKSMEKITREMSDFTTRLKEMWLKRLRQDSRASQGEGRFISLMASMPVPPTRLVLVSSNGWNTTTLI